MLCISTKGSTLCSVISLLAVPCNPMDCSPPIFSVHGDYPGKNTGAGCHALLQGVFPTQGSNPCFKPMFLMSPVFILLNLRSSFILISSDQFSSF